MDDEDDSADDGEGADDEAETAAEATEGAATAQAATEEASEQAGEAAGDDTDGAEPAGDDGAIQTQLTNLTTAVERQNELLKEQHETIRTLIDELQRRE
ncbi:MAG: hypothetical protein BRD21_01315 [Halobacteriales archaeon SW_8_66_22]|nr:MAG: hypothetical protein BRD21_01315 [Halobacteriales archaeon SW_8_66_22]